MKFNQSYIHDLSTISEVPNIDKLSTDKILITGATGLIGSCLADMLLAYSQRGNINLHLVLAGRNIEVLHSRFEPYGRNQNVGFVEYDAMKPLQFDDSFDFIIHCASNAHPAAFATQPVETIMTNICGTRNLLDLLRKAGTGRMLYVSSSEVYGNGNGGKPYKENDYLYIDPLDPRSCYPNSKRLCETLCRSYHEEYGVDFLVVRPGHVYGPTMTSKDSRAHAQFARAAKAHKDIIMKSDGAQLRSYCYVVDCATAILTVLLNGKTAEAYNISNPHSVVTIAHMAEEFAAAGGVKVRRIQATTSEKKGYNRMTCSALDSSKLCSLGWVAHFDAKTGAHRTLQSL